jgi:hypothetical protein
MFLKEGNYLPRFERRPLPCAAAWDGDGKKYPPSGILVFESRRRIFFTAVNFGCRALCAARNLALKLHFCCVAIKNYFTITLLG